MNRSTPYAKAMAEAHAIYLRKCLEESSGNVKEAARIAGLYRTHFYKLCAHYQVSVTHARASLSVFNNPLRRGKAFHRSQA